MLCLGRGWYPYSVYMSPISCGGSQQGEGWFHGAGGLGIHCILLTCYHVYCIIPGVNECVEDVSVNLNAAG